MIAHRRFEVVDQSYNNKMKDDHIKISARITVWEFSRHALHTLCSRELLGEFACISGNYFVPLSSHFWYFKNSFKIKSFSSFPQFEKVLLC